MDSRLLNLHTIGWIAIILASAFCYYLAAGLFYALFFISQSSFTEINVNDPQLGFEMRQTARLGIFISAELLVFFFFILISGIGLIKRKQWGRITYGISGTLFVIAVLSLLGYQFYQFIFQIKPNYPEEANLARKIEILIYGLFYLAIAWAATRSIIFVVSKKNRKLFS